MCLFCEGFSLALLLLFAAGSVGAETATSRELRLIPFPKSVRLDAGSFRVEGHLRVSVGDEPADKFAAEELCREMISRTGVTPEISHEIRLPEGEAHALHLQAAAAAQEPEQLLSLDREKGEEAYALRVSPSGVVIESTGSRGLFYGVQTLKQLIRGNMRNGVIPCLRIEDWPSLRYRGFQDDITRGPSPLLETLKREICLGAEVKQNFFTYYLEHQYAFRKHPDIGPKDGSLTPEELKELLAYAERYHVAIIGNQQSFGHFEDILRHDRYANLRETPSLLCPTIEDSYTLLDDLYSEQVPLLKSPFFNVCCDETWGLGTGPSRSLAEKIGVGGVYARHMRRLHDLLKDKYGKRMMMWGDIILQHPENLKEIPKDTVMLTWGYDARESFESQIVPFARSGYEFFVCPGVSCWTWILPDFDVAVKNIRNFVRDGAAHGAIGVLNTTWDDDGENFFHYNWHGIFWGAECAWNASNTGIDDFNRRFGAVLIGEREDRLGRAIEALSRTHRLPGYGGMRTGSFWQANLKEMSRAPARSRAEAEELLGIVERAIEELRRAQVNANLNGDLLDYLLFGGERMRFMAARTLAFLEAIEQYQRAGDPAVKAEEAKKLLANAIAKIRGVGEAHKQLEARYATLWLRENKPYALDLVRKRFDAVTAVYDSLLGKLGSAREALVAGKGLPALSELGL